MPRQGHSPARRPLLHQGRRVGHGRRRSQPSPRRQRTAGDYRERQPRHSPCARPPRRQSRSGESPGIHQGRRKPGGGHRQGGRRGGFGHGPDESRTGHKRHGDRPSHCFRPCRALRLRCGGRVFRRPGLLQPPVGLGDGSERQPRFSCGGPDLRAYRRGGGHSRKQQRGRNAPGAVRPDCRPGSGGVPRSARRDRRFLPHPGRDEAVRCDHAGGGLHEPHASEGLRLGHRPRNRHAAQGPSLQLPHKGFLIRGSTRRPGGPGGGNRHTGHG